MHAFHFMPIFRNIWSSLCRSSLGFWEFWKVPGGFYRWNQDILRRVSNITRCLKYSLKKSWEERCPLMSSLRCLINSRQRIWTVCSTRKNAHKYMTRRWQSKKLECEVCKKPNLKMYLIRLIIHNIIRELLFDSNWYYDEVKGSESVREIARSCDYIIRFAFISTSGVPTIKVRITEINILHRSVSIPTSLTWDVPVQATSCVESAPLAPSHLGVICTDNAFRVVNFVGRCCRQMSEVSQLHQCGPGMLILPQLPDITEQLKWQCTSRIRLHPV